MARVASRKNCMKKVSRRLHKKATTKRQHQKVIGKASKTCSRKMRVRRAGKKGVRKTSRRKNVRRQPQPRLSISPSEVSIHSQSPQTPIGSPDDVYAFWLDLYTRYFEGVSCQNVVNEANDMRDGLNDLIMRGGIPEQQIDAFTEAVVNRINVCDRGVRPGSVYLANPPLAASPVQAPASPAQIVEYSYEWYLQQFEQAAARVAGVQGECTPSALTRALRSESRNLLIDLNNEDRAAYEIDPRRQNMIRAYNEVLGRCENDPFNNMAQARQAVQNV
jgi:hypothetical protein